MRDNNPPEVSAEDVMKEVFTKLRKDLVEAKIDALVSKVEAGLLTGVLAARLKKHPKIAKDFAKDYGEQ